MHRSILRVLAASALLLGTAACTTLPYSQLPGPTSRSQQALRDDADAVCARLPEAALELGLRFETPVSATNGAGCFAEVGRHAPWWMPGDDGERLQVEVRPAGSGSEVLISARRVAPGQVWLNSVAPRLVRQLEQTAGS